MENAGSQNHVVWFLECSMKKEEGKDHICFFKKKSTLESLKLGKMYIEIEIDAGKLWRTAKNENHVIQSSNNIWGRQMGSEKGSQMTWKLIVIVDILNWVVIETCSL